MANEGRTASSAATQSRHARARLPKIHAKGERISFHDDLYPFILKLTWTRFFALFALLFVLLNMLFAGLYMIIPGSVTGATGFLDHFFFSVETLATIGYGEMTPNGRWAHTIMSLQALFGIGTTAMMTGLIFARFARPTAQILFSDKMVVQPWNGVPHLVFRMANQRQNQMAEAQVSVMVLITESTTEGHTMRRPAPLKLVREKNPMFALTWSAMHEIDDTSPFYGTHALEKLREQKAEIFVSLTGFDETLMQTITARWRYHLEDIVYDARFADVLTQREDGARILDYDKFHEIIPLEGKS